MNLGECFHLRSKLKAQAAIWDQDFPRSFAEHDDRVVSASFQYRI